MTAIWYARFSTFSGLCAGARHHHVRLETHDRDVRVEWSITRAEADRLNARDGTWPYKPGDPSNGFVSRAHAQRAAIAAFKRLSSPGDLLVVDAGGAPGVALAGTVDDVAAVRALRSDWRSAQTLPERDRWAAEDEILARWQAFALRFDDDRKRRTRYGHGAGIVESTLAVEVLP